MKLFGRRPAIVESPAEAAVRTAPPPSGNLFIIGPARSGTTVLLNALNDCPDIFLFGEPNFHHDHGPGFAARYNERHRALSHQETKSSFCPPILAEDADWAAYVARLGETHRWVGSKIVINPRHHDSWLEELYAFHCRHFYAGRHVFTFRSPQAVVTSTRNLQSYLGADLESVRGLIVSYAETVELFTRMLRTLPHVAVVVHEDVDAQTFVTLGSWLGTDLSKCANYYDTARVKTFDASGIVGEERRMLDDLETIFEDLRVEARRGFPQAQLEQNDANIDPTHHTPLGSINRRARALIGQSA